MYTDRSQRRRRMLLHGRGDGPGVLEADAPFADGATADDPLAEYPPEAVPDRPARRERPAAPVARVPESEKPKSEKPKVLVAAASWSGVSLPQPERPADLPAFGSPLDWLYPGDVATSVALTLAESLGGATEPLRIDVPLFFIGRGPGCDLRLPHRGVGNRHAALQRVGNRLLFLDLTGREGVRHNGRAEPFGWFAPGDVLRVGPYVLGRPFMAGEPEAETPPVGELFARRPLPLPAVAGLTLRVLNAGADTPPLPIVRAVTLVGRSPACKLRLSDPSVSPLHLSLLATPRGLLAIDLLSRGGLVVNGAAVPRALLSAGDRVGVGRYRLEVGRESCPETGPVPLAQTLADLHREFADRSRRQLALAARLADAVPPARRESVQAAVADLERIDANRQQGWDRLLELVGESG